MVNRKLRKAANLCASCGGSGWVVQEKEGVQAVEPCSDCRTDLRRDRLLKLASIPPRYFDRGFEVFSVEHLEEEGHRKSLERASKRSVEFVEAFPEVPRGLLFVGPCGVGKTHLSVAILKTLIQEKMITGKFVDEAELLRRLQYSYGPNSPETEREVLYPLLNVELLIWDDLGSGRPTEWVAETIRTVLNHRYTYNKHTVLSTNWPLKAARKRSSLGVPSEQLLEERIGRRLFSRICEMCEIIEMKGPDYRSEIHKARFDFQERHKKEPSLKVPDGLVQCPGCKSRKVSILDDNSSGPGAGASVELYVHCKDCGEHFVARFFPATARVEYPAPPA